MHICIKVSPKCVFTKIERALCAEVARWKWKWAATPRPYTWRKKFFDNTYRRTGEDPGPRFYWRGVRRRCRVYKGTARVGGDPRPRPVLSGPYPAMTSRRPPAIHNPVRRGHFFFFHSQSNLADLPRHSAVFPCSKNPSGCVPVLQLLPPLCLFDGFMCRLRHCLLTAY